jgi:hypothetical protein
LERSHIQDTARHQARTTIMLEPAFWAAIGRLSEVEGTPVKQRAIYANGRCKFYGGLSTGPRTVEEKPNHPSMVYSNQM